MLVEFFSKILYEIRTACRVLIILFPVLSCKAVADPQNLLEEKEALEEKLALSEYELRLTQEDLSKLRTELRKKNESPISDSRGELPNLGGC